MQATCFFAYLGIECAITSTIASFVVWGKRELKGRRVLRVDLAEQKQMSKIRNGQMYISRTMKPPVNGTPVLNRRSN